jgi:hypothetical protein
VSNSFRPARTFVLAIVAALALSGFIAGSASATTATFTPQGSTTWSAKSFTLYDNGAAAATCTPTVGWKGSTYTPPSVVMLGFTEGLGQSSAKCNGSSTVNFTVLVSVTGRNEGGYTVTLEGNPGTKSSPYGSYNQTSGGVGAFTNGFGIVSSTVTFNKAHLGKLANGHEVTLSGTFTVTTGSGGLMTLV